MHVNSSVKPEPCFNCVISYIRYQVEFGLDLAQQEQVIELLP